MNLIFFQIPTDSSIWTNAQVLERHHTTLSRDIGEAAGSLQPTINAWGWNLLSAVLGIASGIIDCAYKNISPGGF